MIDAIASTAAAGAQGAGAAAQVAPQALPPPAPSAEDARLFASLMRPAPPASAAHGDLAAVAKKLAQQLGQESPSLDAMRRSVLEGIDPSDPVKTMFVMADHSLQAHSVFARLHISTSLASAATGVFGNLLRNQQ